jgi:hypothetical protein
LDTPCHMGLFLILQFEVAVIFLSYQTTDGGQFQGSAPISEFFKN